MSQSVIHADKFRDPAPAAVPDFVRTKVDSYFTERMEKTWGGVHILEGGEPDQDSVVLISNDYLSLANHPEITQAQIDSLHGNSNAMLMSPVFLQEGSPQLAFENRMAAWMNTEASVLCQSGYAANVGAVQAIGIPDLPVYVDMFAHASLWDGITAGGMQARPFRHNDPNHLESTIKRHGRGIVLVDSIYSARGSVAPLPELVEVANRHDCVVVVDESHSLGTHGPGGRGLVAAHGLESKVHFVTASLAKTFAGRAGIIACSARLQHFVKCHSFPNIFSSALLPHEIAGLDKTLDLVQQADDRRARLQANASFLRNQLTELGYNVDCTASQIIPLEAGPEQRTMVLRDALEARGVFGAIFFAPATPANRSVVRLSVNADLTDHELQRVVDVCAEIRDEVDLKNWPSTIRKRKAVRIAA